MKRLLSLLCVLTLTLTLVAPPLTAFADEGDTERVINVVYDDSGSMATNNRWSQALYAMEVFAAMMGEEDEMNVYPMNDYRAIEVEGDDPNRVETLVNAMGGGGGTPFSTVEKAMDELLDEDPDKERWLVVLTDGEFNASSQPIGGAEAKLKEYATQGVQVMYLAIDSSASPGIIFQSDESIGFYAYDAVDSTQVLGCITDMANQIFRQQVMPAGHIDISGSTVTVKADIPLKQLLVFAQGDGVTVSDMKLDTTPVDATATYQVEVTDANAPTGSYKADPGLRGVVQTYAAGATPFASGEWTFTCSDTSNLEIYYIAGAEIDCCLTYNGVEVKADERHYAGEYGLSLRFIDPLTGKEIVDSDLLDGAQFFGELNNGGNVTALDESMTTIRLKEGDTSLETWAVLPGNVRVRSIKNYVVYPEPISLTIRAQKPGGDYKVVALGEQAESILITVTNDETGQVITKEEWDAIGDNLSATANGVDFIVKRGDEVGTWRIWPDYVTDLSDTATGDIEVTVKASYELGTQAAAGATNFNIYIAADTLMELKVDITEPEEPIHLNDLGKEKGALVTLYTKDIYTGEFKPLTAQQAEAVQFELEVDALNWDLIPGDTAGTWYLKPKDDAALITFSDESIVVVVTATLEEEVLTYQGSDSAELAVVPLTLVEKIIRLIGIIIGGSVFLFFLLGYLCKKKLRFRQMKPYVQNPETLERLTVSKKRVWWSYLLPWVAQRATITCFVPSYHCTFSNAKIIATGGGNFRILNIQSYASERIRLNGKRVDAAKDRKKSFSHVTLTALNEGEDVIGKAHF